MRYSRGSCTAGRDIAAVFQWVRGFTRVFRFLGRQSTYPYHASNLCTVFTQRFPYPGSLIIPLHSSRCAAGRCSMPPFVTESTRATRCVNALFPRVLHRGSRHCCRVPVGTRLYSGVSFPWSTKHIPISRFQPLYCIHTEVSISRVAHYPALQFPVRSRALQHVARRHRKHPSHRLRFRCIRAIVQ